MNDIILKEEALKETLMCLFEGLTRRLPSFHFIKFVFSSIINELKLHELKDLIY